MAIYRRMPEDVKRDLEALIPWFIDKVEWSSHDGFRLTEAIKVCIAAEACLLIVRRPKDDYRHFRRIKVCPKNMSSFNEEAKWAGDANRTTVRMGWYWAEHGMEDGEDNFNLVIHEFAHVLDFAHDRQAEADIKLADYKSSKEWLAFAKKSYCRLCKLWDRNTRFTEPVIRKYGTTEIAEFFACATEAFFEVSKQLKLAEPEIYDWMEKIYRMNPASWPERLDYSDYIRQRKRRRHQEEERRKREEERQRRAEEELRRYEERRRKYEQEKSKCEKKIEQLEKQKKELDEKGVQSELDALKKQHEKRIREIELRYKGKEVQYKRRIRDAELKLDRETTSIEKQLKLDLEKIARDLRKQLDRLKKIEVEDLTEPKEPDEPEEEPTKREPKRRTVSKFHPDGLPFLKYTVIRNLKDGLFMRWDEDGNLREEMHYHLGIKNGLCTYYYTSGPKELEGNYANDLRAGTWTGWNKDGSVKHESKYRQGRLTEWIRFMPDGTVESFKEPSKIDKAFSKR